MSYLLLRKTVSIVVLAALLTSCKYDCHEAKKARLWKWHGDGDPIRPDVLSFNDSTVITNDCYIMDRKDTLGQIIAGEKRYLTNDQVIVVRYKNGTEIEYVSK